MEKINERAAKSGLPDLRAAALPEGDLEMRFWLYPPFDPVAGAVLKRTNGRRTALRLNPVNDEKNERLTEIWPEPAMGWDELWNRLVQEKNSDAARLPLP
jgi:hypothetical protein